MRQIQGIAIAKAKTRLVTQIENNLYLVKSQKGTANTQSTKSAMTNGSVNAQTIDSGAKNANTSGQSNISKKTE
jgi:hypothetical protein